MSLLTEAHTALGISDATTAFDAEINGLIAAAQADLTEAGVNSTMVTAATDALIKLAILTYCKANFGLNNPEAERLQGSYVSLKTALSLSTTYAMFTVTFTCSTQSKIKFDGKTQWTNTAGSAVFYSRAQNHVPYQINDGTEQYVDVSANITVTV
jgi:hypothetical protein